MPTTAQAGGRAQLPLCACRRSSAGEPWFELAPTLGVYAFMNWDLIAVACTAAAVVASVRRRDRVSGALLGLGAAAKLFPALLIAPLAAQSYRRRDIGDRAGDRRVGRPCVRGDGRSAADGESGRS